MRERGAPRIFISTGEASGDMLGAALAEAIRALAPAAEFSGIGNERMAAAGIRLSARTVGWGSMGPAEGLRRMPVFLFTYVRHVVRLLRDPRDLVVLIDFGAVHVRFGRVLRALRYRGPILYVMPPGAFLDLEGQARAVSGIATPLTAFEHQRDFYRSLGLEIAYFGHPLVSLVTPRDARAAPPADGGRIALLPGSRAAELARHLPRLLGAVRLLRERRPKLSVTAGAADAAAEAAIRNAIAASGLRDVSVVRGAHAAIDEADAAWIASGTAVLEAVLREVPVVALYVIAPSAVPIAKRMWRLPFITLPNILLGRAAVPELLQDDATPERLAAALEHLLADPQTQLGDARSVRARLGDADALQQCAGFALAISRA